MSITIDTLDLADVVLDRSTAVKFRPPGTIEQCPCYAFLIRGAGSAPIVVDAGVRNRDVIVRLGIGADAVFSEETSMEAQLARFDLTPQDIGMVLMTHLHVDHAGLVDVFPMSTPVVVNRAEMAFAAGGLQGLYYAPEDVHHMLDRIYSPDAAMVLDLDLSGPVEIAPGVICEHLGGHTPGLMSIRVETEGGATRICSDVVYDVQDQLIEPIHTLGAWEPQVTNNYATAHRDEKAMIWKAMQGIRYLLPSHDRGAVLEDRRVVGRLGPQIPGKPEDVQPVQGESS